MKTKNTTRRKQTFTITVPATMSVLLAGDFTRWQESAIPLKRKGNGCWETTVTLEPGTYRYRFIVDGQWQDDPNCTLRMPNAYGTEDAVCKVA